MPRGLHVVGGALVLCLVVSLVHGSAQHAQVHTDTEAHIASQDVTQDRQMHALVVDKLQAQVTSLRDERIMLQERVARLRRELAVQHQERTSYEQEQMRLRRRVGELQAQLAASLLQEPPTGEVERLQQAYNQALQEKTDLQTQVATLQAKQQVPIQPIQVQDPGESERNVAQLRRRLTQVEAALRAVEQQAEAVQAESIQWEARYRETHKALRVVQMPLPQPPTVQEAPSHPSDMLDGASAPDEPVLSVQALHAQVMHRLRDSRQFQDVSLYQGVDRLTIQLSGDALFQSKVGLRQGGMRVLDEVAAILQVFPGYRVTVSGHTDPIPMGANSRQCWPTNWELSAARAAVIVRHFAAKGVAPERLIVAGHAFSQPIATNDTSEGRAQNRRIDITISPMAPAPNSES